MAQEAKGTPAQNGVNKIHNADEFGNYVHAVTIPMRVVMAAIVVFFAGALAYCVLGKVPIDITCAAVSTDGCVCYVKSSDRDDIQSGDEVEINGEDYVVEGVSPESITVDETVDDYAREIGDLSLGDTVFVVSVAGDVPQGVYQATIIKDYLNPIEVLLEG